MDIRIFLSVFNVSKKTDELIMVEIIYNKSDKDSNVSPCRERLLIAY
jgi:hypothetical protein